ncbi:MAG: sensor histidine kinase [Planctomycetota bacterium]|jgi:signal transduction histidine kinase
MTEDRSPTDASVSTIVHTPTGQITWRWYHFYFILALFDVVVIIASLTLYHRTLQSYEHSLTGLAAVDARQRWITDIRRSVIELNAPGNDVFESRDVETERDRFRRTQADLHLYLREDESLDINLDTIREQVASMVEQENFIFDTFEKLAASGNSKRAEELLSAATVAMAAMDRYQANAVGTLSDIEKKLQDQQRTLLHEYGQELQQSAAFEKYFLGIVVFILIGVFWYGRKLQRMHEEMIENQQHALAERHERLASVGEVCSSVAHGIRNPLSGITSSAQLALEYGTLDASTELRLKDVLSEARRLDSRINRLLDFAKGGADSRETVDMREVVLQAVDEMNAAAALRDVPIAKAVCDDSLPIHGNKEELVQAVIELISNALDHVPTGGNVTVQCAGLPDNNQVQISVIDNGPGIPEHVRDHVCELFFTTKSEGNGIGLASVKRTVESHQGNIDISTADGGGAHVQALLPLNSHRRRSR